MSMRPSQNLFNKSLRLSLVVGSQTAAMTTRFHFLRPLGRSQRLPPLPQSPLCDVRTRNGYGLPRNLGAQSRPRYCEAGTMI